MDTSTPDHLIARRSGLFDALRREATLIRSDRKRLRRVLLIGAPIIFLGGAFLYYLLSGRYAGTEDSYVRAAKLIVTTDVSGIVADVRIKQGQNVKAGDILFTLDPVPFRIALDNARAKYAQSLLDLQAMKEDYQRMLHDIEGGEAQVGLDQRNFDRDAALVKNGNQSRANYDQSRMTLEVDQRKLDALRQQARSQLAKLGGNPDILPQDHPSAQESKAALDEAQRQSDHATVRAPFDGTVTAVDSLQRGALLISALSAFSTTSAVGLVANKDFWIESQMKETDLTYVKIGNPVSATIDAYPGCSWTGHVASISPASDASFSVLPAENASGNWVKVVQRIGVRINLDRSSCDRPLREGMSAVVSIDTGRRRLTRMIFGPGA